VADVTCPAGNRFSGPVLLSPMFNESGRPRAEPPEVTERSTRMTSNTVAAPARRGTATVVAVALLGSAFGAAFAGQLADRLGRTRVMQIAAALFAVSAVGSALSNRRVGAGFLAGVLRHRHRPGVADRPDVHRRGRPRPATAAASPPSSSWRSCSGSPPPSS